MQQESTGHLMDVLKDVETAGIEHYAEAHVKESPSFAEYMSTFITAHPCNRREIIRRADFPETYGYKLLNGENRTGERDYVLRFCIALGMNLKQTQRALEINEMRPLYPKDKRDTVLIVAINNGMDSVDQVNELLVKHDCAELKRSGQ